MKSTRKAFTLVELLVVIAILAILSSVAVVGYTSFIDKANDSNAETELHQIKAYITAELMSDDKMEFTAEGVKYVITRTSGRLTATAGVDSIPVDVAIEACPDLEGLGTFEIEGEDLVYTSSNGKGTARWEDILPGPCDHASTEVVPGTPATCTATGLTDGTKCKDCDAMVTAQEVINILPHTEETVAGTPATCTATGLTEGKKCSVCGITTVAQNEIPMIDHSAGADGKCSCGASLVSLVVGPWDVDDATERYAVYYFNDSDNGWADMKATAVAGTYEAYVPNGFDDIIFCRMDANITENGWTKDDPFWNQTVNLEVNAGGYFTIVDPWGNDEKATGTWGTVLYLNPSDWVVDEARFAAYFFGNGDMWVDMTDYNGDGIYEVIAPEGYNSVIFCRMNPSTSANNWDNKWNQTIDLSIGSNNCYEITNAWNGSGDKATGTWSTK